MQVNEIVQEFKRFGAVKTFQDLGLRALNRLITVRVLKGVTIDTVASEYLQCEKPYRGEFLSETLLTSLSRSLPEYEISERFLHEAFAKGDKCYGILDGSTLA